MEGEDERQAAVWTDATTGFKCFNTRAELSSPPITSGYRIVDRHLTKLPARRRDLAFDEASQAEYREYNEARRGVGEFDSLEEVFAEYAADVYTAKIVERPELTDSCDVMIVGTGFAGILLWHKIRNLGLDVRYCDRAGDVGGTWYWNRYPGIACDVEAYSYLPLLDEMGYIPERKFASGFEILDYCRQIAVRTSLYERCLFNTEVMQADWNDAEQRWIVNTSRGDSMRTRFLVLAHGIFSTPKVPRIQGLDEFEGKWFHTSRWDHSVDLADKRVGIIGTGATAVQVIPEVAKVAKSLLVFQRTPSTVDVREQRLTTDEEREKWSNEPGWARARRARYAKILSGRTALRADERALSGDYEPKPPGAASRLVADLTQEEQIQLELDANYQVMEQIRERIDDTVEDAEVANALKPHYPYGCKRPTFHDEYLPTFNLPHVELIDTAPHGVERVSQRGIVYDDHEYPLDVLILATGFKLMESALFDVIRVNGISVNDKWRAGGTRTFLAVHTAGFPNLFIIAGPQGGGGNFNMIEGIEEHTDYIAWLLKHSLEHRISSVDVKQEDEDEYAEHCRDADLATARLRECTSFFNDYGRAQPGSLVYMAGLDTWIERCRAAQASLAPYVFTQAPPRDDNTEGPGDGDAVSARPASAPADDDVNLLGDSVHE